MKKVISIAVAMLLFAVVIVGCAATPTPSHSTAAPQGDTPETPAVNTAAITVISREDGSGTRGAFVELFGVLDSDKVDQTVVTAEITNSTSVMMTSVSGDPNAIGYISLGSLNSTVKAAKIDNADASVENINNGSYGIARPFNIAIRANVSELAQDFVEYILSADGQDIVEANGYIRVADTGAYSGLKPSGKITVSGSSSVYPVMEKLVEAYQITNSAADIELQMSDSSTGMKNALDGICDIGMASRDLKDSEIDGGLQEITIAMDGIAIIVNNGSTFDSFTKEQVRQIFTGEVKKWAELG